MISQGGKKLARHLFMVLLGDTFSRWQAAKKRSVLPLVRIASHSYGLVRRWRVSIKSPRYHFVEDYHVQIRSGASGTSIVYSILLLLFDRVEASR